MHIRLFIIFLLFVSSQALVAQDTIRVELVQRYNDTQPIVVPAGELGVVLLDQENDMPPGNMRLVKYDTSLNQEWEQQFPFVKKLNLVEHLVAEGKLYLVFNHEYEEVIEIAIADLRSGEVNTLQFPYFSRFTIKTMCVKKGDIYIAGLLRKLPAAIRLNIGDGSVASLPMAVDGKNVEVGEMFVAKNGKISITVVFEHNRNREVLVKEFDENNSSDDLLIAPTIDFDLINGKVSHLGAKSKIVIGSYGYRNSEATQGFYIAGFYNNQEVFNKYHSFNDLENFYSFKSVREQERIEEKIEKKKKQGKDLRSKYRLLTHEVITQGGNYIMLGEAYYPTYKQQRVRRYSPRGYYYETKIVFDGYKYTHAVVVAFNKKGAIIWDHAFKINDIKSMELKEHVRVNSAKGLTQLVYSLEGKINRMTIGNGEIISKNENIALPSKYQDDEVKFSDLGQSEHWYGNHYLAWGYQRIKNSGEEVGNRKRNVFYINKLSF